MWINIQSEPEATSIKNNNILYVSHSVFKKCSSKFDYLLYEMFIIREHKPCLNIQSDSIKAKLFT